MMGSMRTFVTEDRQTSKEGDDPHYEWLKGKNLKMRYDKKDDLNWQYECVTLKKRKVRERIGEEGREREKVKEGKAV